MQRLLELKADLTQFKTDAQTLEDAVNECMLLTSDAPEDAPMLLIGESFVVSDEDSATAYLQTKLDEIQEKIGALGKEEATIVEKQGILKKDLYGRFGDSINLEN